MRSSSTCRRRASGSSSPRRSRIRSSSGPEGGAGARHRPRAAGYDAREHLVVRGLVAAGTPLEARVIEGGVSCEVIAVAAPDRRFVVKRALPQLRVEQEWRADERRLLAEGRALRLASKLTPGAVPAVVDLDEEAGVLVIDHAPPEWTNWRDDLLAGSVDPNVGRRLGAWLASWHDRTAAASPTAGLDSKASFLQLRVDPFHRAVAERHPDLAPRIEAVAARLLRAADCLVHGDFSPKNVLRGPTGELWVLDWEVVHRGDPHFDLAYMLTHLTLKGIHRPAEVNAYGTTAEAFLTGYAAAGGSEGLHSSPELIANLGCILLARVDGKSPAAYLTAIERERVRELGTELLTDRCTDVLEIWGWVRSAS